MKKKLQEMSDINRYYSSLVKKCSSVVVCCASNILHSIKSIKPLAIQHTNFSKLEHIKKWHNLNFIGSLPKMFDAKNYLSLNSDGTGWVIILPRA